MKQLFDPAILPLDVYPRLMKSYAHTKASMKIFIKSFICNNPNLK